MIILIKIILAHILGDFLLQPKGWVRIKEQKKAASVQLYAHALIHGILILLLLWDWHLWPFALSIAGIHFVIDAIKLYSQKAGNKTQWFIIDQLLHLATLFVIWFLWFKPGWQIRTLGQDPVFWLYVTALLFLTAVSNIIIKTLLTNWAIKIADGENASLTNAGKYIGMLERLFVFLFILIGHWEAIGFLLAAKSVFRFGDLKESKDRKLTEYILTGTLLSFGIAMITGVIVVNWPF